MSDKIKIAKYRSALIALWEKKLELQIAMGLNSFLNIFIHPESGKIPPFPVKYVKENEESQIIFKIRQLHEQHFFEK